jgi:hypothetical protein
VTGEHFVFAGGFALRANPGVGDDGEDFVFACEFAWTANGEHFVFADEFAWRRTRAREALT